MLGHLLDAAGVPASRIPDGVARRSALWRAVTAGRRMLLVLDDAVGPAQVRPLLPAGPGCVTLVAGRHRFGGLDAGRTLWLDMLPPVAAIELLTGEFGAARAAREPAAVAELARTCGYLPVALRLAGTRSRQRPGWSLRDLAERLGRRGWRFGIGLGQELEVAFHPCHAHLTDEQRYLLELAAFGQSAEIVPQRLAEDAGLPLGTVEDLLDQLVNLNLVESPGFGVFRVNELVQRYTMWCAEEAAGRRLDRPVHPAPAG